MALVFRSAGCACFACRLLSLRTPSPSSATSCEPLPAYQHRHGKKENHWEQAERSCYSEWLLKGVHIDTKIVFETSIRMWTRLRKIKIQRWIVMSCERTFIFAS